MASVDIERMKEIVVGSDNCTLEMRQLSFSKLLMLALRTDDLQLFDWLQSNHISPEVKQKSKFSVKTILEAVAYRSNSIIDSTLRNYQKYQISNISQIKNANGQNIFHLSALSHNNKLILSVLINSDLPVELTDSYGIGMKALDVCDNTIFHSAVMAGNIGFIDAIFNYLLPFNINGTPQYTLGFHHFSDKILLLKNFNNHSVFDLLQHLHDKSKLEALSIAVTSLSQLLFNLSHICEVKSYFSSEKPNKDMSGAVYVELMSRIKSNIKSTITDMEQILGPHFVKINSDQYFSYYLAMGYRKTVTCLMNLKTRNFKSIIINSDICGLFWNNHDERSKRLNAFRRWDAVVQEAACCSYGKRSFWDDFFPSYALNHYNGSLEYLKFDHQNENSNKEIARWLMLYSKKVDLLDCSYFISSSNCDKIIAKSFLSHRLWMNSVMARHTTTDLMPIISSYLFPVLETADSMLMEVTRQMITFITDMSGLTESNGLVEKTEYLTEWLVMEAKADPYLKHVSHICGGQTALHLAVASNQILTVKWLVSFDTQLLLRECQANSMLPINYAISVSTDIKGDKQDRTCIAVFLASAMAELLAPYSTDQYAVVGGYLDSRGRSIASFASGCRSTKVKALLAKEKNELQMHELSKEQFITFQNKAYKTLCDQMLSNQSLQDIVGVCTDNGWMPYFQANKLNEVGSAAEHQFLYQAVLAQRCDVLDWYCTQVEGLLFPWLWDFNTDISMPQPGLLHTTLYAEEDTSGTCNRLCFQSSDGLNSLRNIAVSLKLRSIISWIESCKSSAVVESYRTKRWFETTLVTYEGYYTSKLGFRGALQSGASARELSSLFTLGNEAVISFRNSLKDATNKLMFDAMLSKGILTETDYSTFYSTVLVANANKLYSWPDGNDIYKQAFRRSGNPHVIEWLISMAPDNYLNLRKLMTALEEAALAMNRLDILKVLRASKHSKHCHSIADLVRRAAAYAEFDIFCHYYESIEVISSRPPTALVLSYLLKNNLLSYYSCIMSNHQFFYRIFPTDNETEAQAISRKQINCVKIVKYIIAKTNIWPDARNMDILRLFSDHKDDGLPNFPRFVKVPLELCEFLMEEIGFELCQIIPLTLLEDFPPLLRLYKKSIYEVKVADMIATGATVAELEAFTELHCISPQAIRGVDGMPMTHLAAKHNRMHILQWLLEKGSDLHAVDRNGRSTLETATLCQSADVLKLLAPLLNIPVPEEVQSGDKKQSLSRKRGRREVCGNDGPPTLSRAAGRGGKKGAVSGPIIPVVPGSSSSSTTRNRKGGKRY